MTPSGGSSSSASISGRGFAVAQVDPAQIQRRLSIGSQLSARIVDAHGQGKYTVGFAGLRMIAESGLELAVGQRVLVEVAALEPKIHLRVMDAKGNETFEKMLKHLAGDLPEAKLRELMSELMEKGLPLDQNTLKRAIAAMKQGLSPRASAKFVSGNFPLSDSIAARAMTSEGSMARALSRLMDLLKAAGRSDDAAKIHESLRWSGNLKDMLDAHPLKMERRLLGENPAAERDGAKALLLALADGSATGGEADKEISRAATELLEILEGRYLYGEPEPEIPFVVEDDGLRDGSLAADRGPGRAQVRIRLDTSRLGNVVGVIDSRERRLGVSLGVPRPEAREALLAAVPELKAALRTLGFEMDSMTVDVLRPKEPATAASGRGIGFDVKA